jgi:hypothetical protein
LARYNCFVCDSPRTDEAEAAIAADRSYPFVAKLLGHPKPDTAGRQAVGRHVRKGHLAIRNAFAMQPTPKPSADSTPEEVYRDILTTLREHDTSHATIGQKAQIAEAMRRAADSLAKAAPPPEPEVTEAEKEREIWKWRAYLGAIRHQQFGPDVMAIFALDLARKRGDPTDGPEYASTRDAAARAWKSLGYDEPPPLPSDIDMTVPSEPWP